ncbi:MAG TPA: pyruvate kinase, partial [Candidatus Marinimicrobia bacterium]|nr:pyruvate kinase [Candidatus Neomarinimicrobiota bacterium]
MEYRRTKIIATLGPQCSDQKSAQALVEMGVNCFRINLSHGTAAEKKSYFDLVRSISQSEQERPAILADLAGPKIRISGLNGTMDLKTGEKVIVSNEQNGPNVIPVSSSVAFQEVNPGAKIMIDDGQIALEVISQVSNHTLECCTEIPGEVKNRKGVNFPGIALNVPCLTEQDLIDLELALSSGADWIALSFAREAKDYHLVRSRMKNLNFNIPVMAKIEKWEAVENLDEIIETFDAVMVARGDLGVELPVERVPLIQKSVIDKASQAGKPVVIATQILDSMTERPVPTRAEVSDIANAILDGADGLMV